MTIRNHGNSRLRRTAARAIMTGALVALAGPLAAAEATPQAPAQHQLSLAPAFGPENGDWVRWSLAFARNQEVISYTPNSRFFAELERARLGELPWYDVLTEPGFVLGAPIPTRTRVATSPSSSPAWRSATTASPASSSASSEATPTPISS
jgi:hypothetical protein